MKKKSIIESIDRKKVQDALAEGLLAMLPHIGVVDCVDHRRRVARAFFHIGMGFMLDGGDNIDLVKKALDEALKNEMSERKLTLGAPGGDDEKLF